MKLTELGEFLVGNYTDCDRPTELVRQNLGKFPLPELKYLPRGGVKRELMLGNFYLKIQPIFSGSENALESNRKRFEVPQHSKSIENRGVQQS